MEPTRRSVLTRSSVALAGLFLAGSASADSSVDSRLAAVAQSGVDEVSDEQVADLASAVTAFGLDVHHELRAAEPGENLLVSPYSASIALAMTWAGARGETETEMADVLRFPFDQDELHAVYEALDATVDPPAEEDATSEDEDGDEPEDFTLETANTLWGHETFPFDEAFLSVLETHYGGGLQEVDFAGEPEAAREAINEWVETQTEDRIEDLLPPGSITPLTRFVLTNAVYFAANWASTFDEEATEDATFTTLAGETVTVPTMTQAAHFGHAEVDGTQVLSLPYVGNEVDMVVLVPPAGEFEAFEASLDAATLSSLFDELERAYGTVSLPKFSYESDFSLVDTLEALGMDAAFDPAASNFDGMVTESISDLYVHDALQKTFIDVDEQGTEAAAATAVIGGPTSAPVPSFEVTADRPFLYAIRHRETNAALFLGRVVDLEGEESGDGSGEILDQEFEALETTTDPIADDATISVDETADWQVVISGRLQLPSPCYDVSLSEASYEDGTLRVVLEREQLPDVDGCAGVVIGAEYEARFALSVAPDTVVVEHANNEWETTWEADGESPPSVGEYDPLPAGEDGLYRDVDGSGTLGSNDVVTFFEHLEGPAISEYPDYYDFNGSGSVGFDDVVALFERI